MQQKNAIITGTSRGIGREMVRQFAQAGYDVWACARSKTQEFEDYLKETADQTGRDVKPVYFDLADEDQVKAAVKEILKERRPVDVLVNNAGIPFGAPFNMTSTDKLREVYQINVISQVLLMQLVSRPMMRQKKGCIINLCSVGGIETSPGYLAYGSSKAALIWITKEAAKEYGPYGIRVNGIAPGLIDTEMGHYKSQEELEKVLNRQTIHRMGKPEEIAKAALFIAGETGEYMTGQIMVLDGGRV